MYDEFYHSKRDYARTMCVIDLASMQRPYVAVGKILQTALYAVYKTDL
ncbi:hypothetical protein ALC53_02308 [Atta colombica]|uniref:Uncharacterized protein n=1 Tax=Atta colombica TaxID=520822 RepID=A0A195BRB0_9HYME|nr:hypothetical protein ALC53_02308 [Atta colombica]